MRRKAARNRRIVQEQGNGSRFSPDSDIMTLKGTAKYLGLHAMTLYTLARKGKVPAVKLGGQWRFKKATLDEWLEIRMRKHARMSLTPAHT